MGERILVAEDERALRDNLVRFLRGEGHAADGVGDGEAALERVRAGAVDILLTDLRLPRLDGLELARRTRAEAPDTFIFLMTAYASVDSAVEALRLGACDYLLKPLVLDELGARVANLQRMREVLRENARLRRELGERAPDEVELVASSPAMREVMQLALKAGSTRSNVLLTGPTGVGKERVARAVHAASAEQDRPFVAVNVSAVPAELMESQLFGHERGSFTGAERRREGVFRATAGGTLFLDEIGEMPLPLQAKLLRAIEAREVTPVGADLPVRVDVRVIAATHRDVEAMVAEGKFREDLYYRLNVIRIRVPPLRERPEDIAALAPRLVARHARAQGRRIEGIAEDAMGVLYAAEWRGNVRELSNALERAVLLSPGPLVRAEDLPLDLRARTEVPPSELKAALRSFERRHIARVLQECGGNREQAARRLGLSQATLYRRLEQYRGDSHR